MKTEVATQVRWNTGKKEQLLGQSDKIVYEVARRTLDMTYTHIPLANYVNAGKLRQSSTSAGVRGESKNYYIGSYTTYAKYVYKMDNSKTNWTTPGTNSKWYEKVWKTQGKNIVSQAIERNKIR